MIHTHLGGRCGEGWGLGRIAFGVRIKCLGQAEVQHLHRTVWSELDVRGLQVPMDHASFVGGLQGLGDLFRYWQGFIERNGALFDPVCQGRPLDQLQHQGTSVVSFLKAVDGRDAGVVQAGEDLRFTLEPGEPIRIGGNCFREDLQRHLPVQLGIGGLVHLAHAAFADLGGDGIRAEGGAGGERHG